MKTTIITRQWLLALELLAMLMGMGLFSACGKKGAVNESTGVTYSAAQVRRIFPRAILGDASFAQVNRAWLPLYYQHYRQNLFNLGITQWDNRFDCTHFAAFYADLAQAIFYRDHFQDWTSAQTLAIGEIWYHPAWEKDPRINHAIDAALTNEGAVFVEPQNGQSIILNAAELASITMEKF